MGKTPAWSLNGCVTLGMFLNSSELLCPHPMDGEKEADWPGFWGGGVNGPHGGQGPAPPSQGKVMSPCRHPNHPALLVWVRSSSLCAEVLETRMLGWDLYTPLVFSCVCVRAHVHVRTHRRTHAHSGP